MTIFKVVLPTVEQMAGAMMWVLCAAGTMLGLLMLVAISALVIDIVRKILRGGWTWD